MLSDFIYKAHTSIILKFNDVRLVQVNKKAKAVCCFEKGHSTDFVDHERERKGWGVGCS